MMAFPLLSPLVRKKRERQRNREKSRSWRARNPERFRDRCAEWRRKNPETMKNILLRSRYGISLEERNAMLSAQKGFCALCRVEEATDLDHDHTSGTIRGILCHSCNKGLGYFKDDPKIMKRAIAYIRGAKRGSES